jgi:hypothetical protein
MPGHRGIDVAGVDIGLDTLAEGLPVIHAGKISFMAEHPLNELASSFHSLLHTAWTAAAINKI